MDRDNLFWGGTNRGARQLVEELTPKTLRLYAPTVLLADPKGNRAAQFAEVLTDHFATLTPEPLPMKVQDALAVRGDLAAGVLTLDTIPDTAATLAARRASQRVTFQITGRGPGGPAGTRIALQGTLTPGDYETQRSVSLLLPTLGELSRAASSRELTGPDPVTAAVLQPLRRAASMLTARHLGEKERLPRDLFGGPLSVLFGQTAYPLTAVHGGAQEQYSQQTALALESAGVFAGTSVITGGKPALMVVVALVIPHARTVHFMRVALTGTGKRSVAGVTSFVPPRASTDESALFTD